MTTFLLPYIVLGKPAAQLFASVTASNITAAACKAEEQLRADLTKKEDRYVCVAVAEVDYTFRDRKTGQLIAQPAPKARNFFRRRRRGW